MSKDIKYFRDKRISLHKNRYPMFYQRINGKSKKIMIHRLLMSEKLGRELSIHDIVHHKDGNTLNYNINNLQLMTAEEHILLHKKPIIKDQYKHIAKKFSSKTQRSISTGN